MSFFSLSLFLFIFLIQKTTIFTMSAPKLEDLPKVAVDLKSQLEGFSTDNLKDTVTQEKIVLPTAEGMKQPIVWSVCIFTLFVPTICSSGRSQLDFAMEQFDRVKIHSFLSSALFIVDCFV